MKNIKMYVLALPLLLGFLLTAPAQAVAINWTLSGVTFNDGGTAGGIFSTDSGTGGLLSWDITTTAGSTLGGFHYDSSSSILVGDNFFSPNSFLVAVPTSFSPYLNLSFINPLTAVGVNSLVTGFNPQTSAGSWECNNCTSLRSVTNGAAVSAIPEPETYAMMLAGLGLLGFAARRRKQAQAV